MINSPESKPELFDDFRKSGNGVKKGVHTLDPGRPGTYIRDLHRSGQHTVFDQPLAERLRKEALHHAASIMPPPLIGAWTHPG
ncbi:MAG: hypothetical protein JO076_10705 [Verrucomicrobia bacterium]|nr:hypothetical protein [Verrucomicrobiota bacterium]